jgi:tetratricopeptide (TPR) repeat protein
MKNSLFSVLLLCWLSSGPLLAQHSKLDSLVNLLKTDKEDTLKVKHLNAISRGFRRNGNTTKGMDYAQEALKLASDLPYGKEKGWPKGRAQAYNNIGAAYEGLGQFGKALEAYSQSIKIGQTAGDKLGVATSYNNIGIVYFNQGD